jgi:hypothetical protein
VRRPEIILGELLRTYARGDIASVDSGVKFMYRAVVLAVDDVGGMLSGPTVGAAEVSGIGVDGRGREYRRVLGPSNPRGSVKAILIDAARDAFYDEDAARVLWPFFPTDQVSLPISPGEHVYSVFEDSGFEHGLWICRVSGHDGPNFNPGASVYADTQGQRRLQDLFEPTAPAQVSRGSDDVSTRVRPSKRRLNSMF